MVKSLNRQSVIDIALHQYGTAEACFDLALENGISITDELAPGTDLKISNIAYTDIAIVNYYKSNGIVPATDYQEIVVPPQTADALVIGEGNILIIGDHALILSSN